MSQNITFNGMKDVDQAIKDSLVKQGAFIIQTAMKDNGHLGDVIAGLGASIDILTQNVDKLKEIFKKQKDENDNN